jgi:hypothetical protein
MFGFWHGSAMLAWETQEVMWLRTIRMMQGGKIAQREAHRMVTEKVLAASEAASQLAAGKTPDHVVRSVRRIVRANKRRLSL